MARISAPAVDARFAWVVVALDLPLRDRTVAARHVTGRESRTKRPARLTAAALQLVEMEVDRVILGGGLATRAAASVLISRKVNFAERGVDEHEH